MTLNQLHRIDAILDGPSPRAHPLGAAQRGVLECLGRHGPWSEDWPTWTWGSHGRTQSLMQVLVRRGLVVAVEKSEGAHVYQLAESVPTWHGRLGEDVLGEAGGGGPST